MTSQDGHSKTKNQFSISNLFAQIYTLQTLEEGNTSIITVKLEKKSQDKL